VSRWLMSPLPFLLLCSPGTGGGDATGVPMPGTNPTGVANCLTTHELQPAEFPGGRRRQPSPLQFLQRGRARRCKRYRGGDASVRRREMVWQVVVRLDFAAAQRPAARSGLVPVEHAASLRATGFANAAQSLLRPCGESGGKRLVRRVFF